MRRTTSATPACPVREAARAFVFVEGLLRPSEPIVFAGDFNVADPGLAGLSTPGEGIDDVLVRGARALEVSIWSRARRTVNGVVLSDHAPVDCLARGDRMTLAEARALFPVLERIAYLNAGTFGPLAAAGGRGADCGDRA